jgi:predicted transcriptional regulator
MYRAFLSYKQLEEHLLFLTEKGLLRYDGNTRTFRTTEKGIQFLEMYNHLRDIIKYEHKEEENNNKNMEADKESIKQNS